MNIDEKNMIKYFNLIKDSININSLKNNNPNEFQDLPIDTSESIYMFDFGQNKITYKKGFQNILGYHDDEITLELLFSSIHPDDSEIVNRIIRASIIYCLKHPTISSNNLLTLNYRRRKKDGTYIDILSKSSIYELDNEGKLLKGIARFTDVSFMKSSINVSWTFIADQLDEDAFKKCIYKVYKDFFTGREIDIIKQIIKKYPNKTIGNKLNISKHTVATHRKNILKKANCHNFEELIPFCKGIGVL